MNMEQLAGKLGPERIRQYESAAVWQSAIGEGAGWREAVLDPAMAAQAWRQMTAYAQETLRTLLLAFGAAPVEEERLLHKLRESTLLAGAECLVGLRQLEEAGIVFAVRKVWGERLIFQPWECYAVWHRLVFPYNPQAVVTPVRSIKEGDGVHAKARRPFGKQLMGILSQLARSELTFTGKGALPKKTTTGIVKELEWDDEALRVAGTNWSHNVHYPLCVAFVLEAGCEFGLLAKTDEGLRLNEGALDRWLRLTDEVREGRLLGWVCQALAGDLGAEAGRMAALTGLPAGRWFLAVDSHQTAAAGASGMKRQMNDAGRDEAGGAYDRLVALFRMLGWLELAETDIDGEPRRVIRWRRYNKHPRQSLIVQPTGELIAGPDCSFAIRWELELIGERRSEEEVAVYAITAASMAAALDYGRSKREVLEFLTEAGGEAPPDTVVAMIEEWTSRAGRCGFAEVTLLRCDSDRMAEMLERVPGVAPYMLEKLGNRDFIVQAGSVGEIRRLLQKAGYPPRKGIVQGDQQGDAYPRIPLEAADSDEAAVNAQEEGSGASGAFLYETNAIRHYELDSGSGRPEVQLLSGLRNMPSKWSQELRSYHHSTRKELMQQAVSLQTAVQLKLGGQLRSFIPERLEQRGGAWSVTGKLRDAELPEVSRLTPDMWDEMRLVIPEGLST